MITDKLLDYSLSSLDILYSNIGNAIDENRKWDWESRISKNKYRYKNLSQYTLLESGFIFPDQANIFSNSLDYLDDNSSHCSRESASRYIIFITEGRVVLSLYFCFGQTYYINKLDKIWNKSLRSTLIRLLGLINIDGYKKEIIISGHSAGAALSNYLTTRIFRERLLTRYNILPRDLYVILFGLGRIPTDLVEVFSHQYQLYQFNIIDILAYDTDKNVPDVFIDDMTIISNKCPPGENQFDVNLDVLRNQNALSKQDEFKNVFIPYCRNDYKGKPKSQFQNIDLRGYDTSQGDTGPGNMLKPQYLQWYQHQEGLVQDYLNLLRIDISCDTNPNQRKKDINDLNQIIVPSKFKSPIDLPNYCLSDSNWGHPYSSNWNKCINLYNYYHSHNTVNTFLLVPGNKLISYNKNTFLRDYQIRDFNWEQLNTMHKILTYSKLVTGDLVISSNLDLEEPSISAREPIKLVKEKSLKGKEMVKNVIEKKKLRHARGNRPKSRHSRSKPRDREQVKKRLLESKLNRESAKFHL